MTFLILHPRLSCLATMRSHTFVTVTFIASTFGQKLPFPAVEKVSGESVSGAPWSPTERLQLTDQEFAAIAEALPESAHLWKFDDEAGTPIEAGECRGFPGDDSWPSSDIWNMFDKLLGEGALIPTVPLAAACYDSWGVYDEGKCASIQENFNNSYLQ